MKKTQINVGDIVKSDYRARWVGVIRTVSEFKYPDGSKSVIATGIILKSSKGVKVRKTKFSLNIRWLTKVEGEFTYD